MRRFTAVQGARASQLLFLLCLAELAARVVAPPTSQPIPSEPEQPQEREIDVTNAEFVEFWPRIDIFIRWKSTPGGHAYALLHSLDATTSSEPNASEERYNESCDEQRTPRSFRPHRRPDNTRCIDFVQTPNKVIVMYSQSDAIPVSI